MSAMIWMVALVPLCSAGADAAAEHRFTALASRYVEEAPALSPTAATLLGDHRHDSRLDGVTADARQREADFYRRFLGELKAIDFARLTPASQVDYSLLEFELEAHLWRLETLQEWAWNPLVYTALAGDAVYGLLAREFAPLNQRLLHAADRLEQFPRLFAEIRGALDPRRVPRIHAETAIQQNRGVLDVLEQVGESQLAALRPGERLRWKQVAEAARAAVEQHQRWLEAELLPQAAGDFRLGAARFDEKLAFTLKTPLRRGEIRERAERELARVRGEMYRIAQGIYRERHPYTEFPGEPSDAYQRAVIRACLEIAYADAPSRDGVLDAARHSLRQATDFVRRRDLLTLPPDPLEIIVMPEFKRGVSLAYCDSPGPLDVGLKTFYAVAPLPEDWTETQVASFLREYNVRSIHDLTMHEAMPGHFVQLAKANRYPGRLRALLASGVFIEGWAIYAERMMLDEGFLDADPLMRLINLKWYLRGIGNAILDQSLHAGDMTRDQALRLMMEDTFQEEREAAAKWVRAQLTSAQLSTYFVGAQEHFDLRREFQRARGEQFDVKTYHDQVLSYGSPPVQHVRALLLGQPIPRLDRP